MTLNEKFDKATDGWIVAHACEQIADDYAIEFAKWKDENCYYISYSLYKMYRKGDEKFELEELLEIFKKEKGS
jgi:hypothetical protein